MIIIKSSGGGGGGGGGRGGGVPDGYPTVPTHPLHHSDAFPTQQLTPRSACGSVGLLSKTFTPVSLVTSPVRRTDGLWARGTNGRLLCAWKHLGRPGTDNCIGETFRGRFKVSGQLARDGGSLPAFPVHSRHANLSAVRHVTEGFSPKTYIVVTAFVVIITLAVITLTHIITTPSVRD